MNPVIWQRRRIAINRRDTLNVTYVVVREGALYSLPPVGTSIEVDADL
jgi:hypothetical protein